jgi:hypothetical protein
MPGRGELFEPFEAGQNQMTREKWMMLITSINLYLFYANVKSRVVAASD